MRDGRRTSGQLWTTHIRLAGPAAHQLLVMQSSQAPNVARSSFQVNTRLEASRAIGDVRPHGP